MQPDTVKEMLEILKVGVWGTALYMVFKQ